jgi:hypothetical protein
LVGCFTLTPEENRMATEGYEGAKIFLSGSSGRNFQRLEMTGPEDFQSLEIC